MADRRKNKDAKWKANIARSLRQKGNKIRKGAKKVASKAVIKTTGAVGYGLGRFEDKIGAAGKKLSKNSSKELTPAQKEKIKKTSKKVNSAINKGFNKLDRGTRLKSSGAFLDGYVKGSVDREVKKNDKKRK